MSRVPPERQMPNHYSIAVLHDASYRPAPWVAELRDSDIRAELPWVMRFRGASVESAILGLAAMGEEAFKWGEEVTQSLISAATVEITRTVPDSRHYTNRMDDENDSKFPSDADPLQHLRQNAPRRRCEKCNIGTEKYANGDATQISDRPDRLNVIRKMCYICGLKEQLERLECQKRLGAGVEPTPERDFDGWLTTGDLVRGAGLSIRLEGDLPEPSEGQLKEFIFEYGRGY